MKTVKYERHEERNILIGIIVDDTVCGAVASNYNRRLFRSKWANLICKWCVEYYEKYGKAPMKQIEPIFEGWAATANDKASAKTVQKLLENLSGRYKKWKKDCNSNYTIDTAGKLFNKIRLERLSENITDTIESGDVKKAEEMVESFDRLELGLSAGVDVFDNKEAVKQVFERGTESIIKYRGALGKFFGNSLGRDCFVSFMGPDKRGKSFWLLDVTCRAIMQHRKVLFLEAGDNSQSQVMARIVERICKRPIGAKEILYPKGLTVTNGKIRVKRKKRKFSGKLSYKEAWKVFNEFTKDKLRGDSSLFRLSCHPNSSLSVKDIDVLMLRWSKSGWVPDVVVIDYADILNMQYSYVDGRERINETWKRLRGISQKYHCLLITATQSDSAAYTKETLGMENFSDDKRKNAHVTGMIGLNMNLMEKEKSVIRLNWIVRRSESYNSNKCVYSAMCLDIANTAIRSCYGEV